jgi:photosystem II stability/assembly factor-like uncharacterized protein
MEDIVVLKKMNNLSLIFITLLIFIPNKNLLSQQTAWQSSGPFLELAAEGITYFHSDPNIMLTGNNGVIYRSTNAGETWEYKCFYDGTIATIEMDPFLENVIYIGTSNTDGIYMSEDYGNTWTQIGMDGARINTIAIDKNNTDVIYAGAGKRGSMSDSEITGIFKSTDGGSTWDQTYSEEIDCVNEIIIDKNDPSIIYASIGAKFDERDEGAFLKSMNNGNSWVRRHISGSWYPEAFGLVQSPGANGELYCVSNASGNHRDLWRSLNKGESWEEIHVYYFAGPVRAVVVDPQNTNTLYAYGTDFTDRGFYKSTNRGNDWTNINSDIPYNIYDMLINPDDGGITITSSSDGILQSKTGGIIWDARPVNSYIKDLAIHPNDDDMLFAAIAGEKLFKSNDGNNSWEKEGSSVSDDNVVTFSSGNPEIVGAAGGKYFHKSTDGGDNFSNYYYSFMSCSDSPCDSYPEELLFSPNSQDRIIIGTSGDDGVLSMSSNRGTEWGYIQFSTSAFVFDPTNSSNIYVGTKNEGGVFKFEDVWGTSPNIINLTPISGIGNVNDIAADKDSKLYVAAEDGLWNWDGSDWIEYDGLPADNITAVLLDESENPDNLYAGTEHNGVYLSMDGGVSWSEFNNGLVNLSITKLAISETNAERIYAGTMRGGVWSTDLVVGLTDEIKNIPTNFILHQNYPNPFNPETIISYEVPELSFVTVRVFDVLGKEVVTLNSEEKPSGNYQIEFDATTLPSGVYFYRLQAVPAGRQVSGQSFVETKKMILLK